MKKTIKLALVAAMAMGATSAFATNGDNLIGLGAKSRAMGGTGIAHFNGAESATSNPALITKSKGTNFAFGGTYFRPDVEVTTTAGGTGWNGSTNPGAAQSAESDAKHNVIPYVALTENFDNGFAVGVSMFGSAGMGTDWRSSAPMDIDTGNGLGLYSMRSNLLLLKFSVPIAYGQDNWSVGIAPVMMYGSLDMSFNTLNLDNSGVPITGAPSTKDIGNGSSASFGYGVELGASYTVPDMGLTLGAIYHSAIEMEYKDQISTTAAAFGFGVSPVGAAGFTDKLEQPAEYGLGLDWSEGDISVAADWKNIRWGNARGYQDFGWENQNVYALGAEYRMDDLALRIGYNYAKNPIKSSGDTSGIFNSSVVGDGTAAGGGAQVGHALNALNHVMFPAVTERHYTIGAGYQFTKNVGADFAFTYATSPDVTVAAQTVGLGDVTVTNDQMAFSANLNYSF
jgi:long-chain fatty acid transport protein